MRGYNSSGATASSPAGTSGGLGSGSSAVDQQSKDACLPVDHHPNTERGGEASGRKQPGEEEKRDSVTPLGGENRQDEIFTPGVEDGIVNASLHTKMKAIAEVRSTQDSQKEGAGVIERREMNLASNEKHRGRGGEEAAVPEEGKTTGTISTEEKEALQKDEESVAVVSSQAGGGADAVGSTKEGEEKGVSPTSFQEGDRGAVERTKSGKHQSRTDTAEEGTILGVQRQRGGSNEKREERPHREQETEGAAARRGGGDRAEVQTAGDRGGLRIEKSSRRSESSRGAEKTPGVLLWGECEVCGLSYGYCMKCSQKGCRQFFHPLCAQLKGGFMEMTEQPGRKFTAVAFCMTVCPGGNADLKRRDRRGGRGRGSSLRDPFRIKRSRHFSFTYIAKQMWSDIPVRRQCVVKAIRRVGELRVGVV